MVEKLLNQRTSTATETITLRVSPTLKARIVELARKKDWSVNKWVIHALQREIRPR